MTINIPYVTPKLEILLGGHHHKLQNLQEAMNVAIFHVNLINCESQSWNKVNSIKLKLKELIFCYTVALKILNELCFMRKCLEKALKANSNVRKTQFRYNWMEERLGKILQRRDRAGARVRRGDKLFRSTNDRYLHKIDNEVTEHNKYDITRYNALSNGTENCYGQLVEDFGCFDFSTISHSKASKLGLHRRNSNCGSGNSIFDSGKHSSTISHMAISCSTSHKSSKSSIRDSHNCSHAGSLLFSLNKQNISITNQMIRSKFAPGYIDPYFGNSKDHNFSEYKEREKLDGSLQTLVFQGEELNVLDSNSFPVMKLSNSKYSLEFQDNLSQINSGINPSNIPFIYRQKKDFIYQPFLDCCCLFFRAEEYFPSSNSANFLPFIDTNYPQNLNFPSNVICNLKTTNNYTGNINCKGTEQVNLVPNLSIDKQIDSSNEMNMITSIYTILEQNHIFAFDSLENIYTFEDIYLINDLQDDLLEKKDLMKLFTSCNNVIVRYNLMKKIISYTEIFDDILKFSFQVFNISNWRLHFDLLRHYRLFVPKCVEITSNPIYDFKYYLDNFSISEHYELVVESSLLLRYYFPSEENEIFLASALLDNKFKLYWIIICTFCIKHGTPPQTVISTILARLMTDTHEESRIKLIQLIGLIKDWEFELYNHCYIVLSQLLWKDPSRNVRKEIGKILMEIGMSKDIIKENLYRLENDDKLIRLRAVKSLGSFHVTNSKCIRKLFEILEIDSSMAVKLETIKTLSILSIHESKILSVIIQKSRGEGYVALEAQKVLKMIQQ